MIPPMARKMAVIDVGSNTVRLLVARLDSSSLVPLHTERIPLPMARDLESGPCISAENVAAAAQAVRRLCADARAYAANPIEILVTSPARQAENGVELVEAIERSARRPVRAVSAEEEAQLAFAGAVEVADPDVSLVAVVDLGGASTEIAVGPPATGSAWIRSLDLGALRLATRFLAAEHPSPSEVEAARAAVEEAFEGVVPPLPGAVLAVGGSTRALGRVLGTELGPGELQTAITILPGCTHEQLVRRFEIGRRRAPLLLAAALILAEVQRRLVRPLRVSEGGVREGALLLAGREAAAA
jgi:exopolyphosphatase / guanosine-5'-triphosphate,3'-diphosphate pyrophosphatase